MVLYSLLYLIYLEAQALSSVNKGSIFPLLIIFYWKTPRFIFAPWMVMIWLPILKHLLIRHLALLPLWTSYMSSQTIAIFNLDNALITWGFEVSNILLKMWLFFKIVLTILESIDMLVFSIEYRISIIFK